MSSVREVLPGREYFIPDTMEKANPLDIAHSDFSATVLAKPTGLAKAIYTSFTGVSPIVAEEICLIAGIDSNTSPKDLSEDLLLHLYKQFCIFFETVAQRDYHPCIYSQNGEPQEFSAIPLSHFSNMNVETYDSISSLLEIYYATRNSVTRIRQKSVDLRKIVQTALERNRKKYDLQAKQLTDTENRNKYRIYGELINTYGYGLDPNAKQLEALNYYTNEMITIPLDPAKTPQENAQKYFDKYNKQKRTFEALTQLIQETKDDITYLESVSNALDIALTEDDLTQIKEELITARYVRRKFTKQKVKITSKPLHYVSSDGYHMYVGKNNLQNEELTFQFATGNDWWFHAKGCPGSHVIVKTNGDELPDRTFEEAGKLAAYYSQNRGNEKVEIDYIQKKHIKKPAGARPGFVIYHTNYSLIIDSDISMLKIIP